MVQMLYAKGAKMKTRQEQHGTNLANSPTLQTCLKRFKRMGWRSALDIVWESHEDGYPIASGRDAVRHLRANGIVFEDRERRTMNGKRLHEWRIVK